MTIKHSLLALSLLATLAVGSSSAIAGDRLDDITESNRVGDGI